MDNNFNDFFFHLFQIKLYLFYKQQLYIFKYKHYIYITYKFGKILKLN